MAASGNSTSGRSPSPSPPRNLSNSGSATVKKRIRHACDRCRLTRSKCSGGVRCVRCIKENAVCVYGDHKRERSRKELALSHSRIQELESENETVVDMLRQVVSTPTFDSMQHPEIVDLLAKYGEEAVPRSPSLVDGQHRDSEQLTQSDAGVKSEIGGEGNVCATVASPGRQGELSNAIDLDNGAGAVGVVGKMSAMSWIQRCLEHSLQRGAATEDANERVPDLHAASTQGLSYFIDDRNLLAVDEDYVNPFLWPRLDIAIGLTKAFFHGTQGGFAFLSSEEFLESLYACPPNDATISSAQRRWLALANLVWAIGAKWLRLTKLDGSEMIDDHLVYYARARALGLDHRILYDHPNEEIIGEMGILTLYLLMNGSITRAWNTIGNAIRQAMTLGLHLKVTGFSIGKHQCVKRARTWFSMYKLQMLIAEITGRSQLIQSTHVTVSLQLLQEPFSGRSRNTSAQPKFEPSIEAQNMWVEFIIMNDNMPGDALDHDSKLADLQPFTAPIPQFLFLHHVQLCQLSADVADQLYTGSQEIPWTEMQTRITNLQKRLDAWKATLSDGAEFDQLQHTHSDSPEAMHLLIYSCSVAMMIHRACLCEIKIPDESQRSKSFNLTSAQACINAALSMIQLLPSEFATRTVYRLFPWWALLHYLCQAAAVLLLELYLNAQHLPGEFTALFQALDKAMLYLERMAEHSLSAYRAWRIFHELLARVSVRYGKHEEVQMMRGVARPDGWTASEENDLLAALY